MFYKIEDLTDPSLGLTHDPFKAIIAPRPIGWISTVDKSGTVNLAPYSFFNALSANPAVLMFSSETLKDSARNARDTGEFVFSLATVALQDQMNISSDTFDSEINEFEQAKLESAASKLVAPPRVAQSPAAMECKTLSFQQLQDLDGSPMDTYMVTGQVVGIHIRDEFIKDGRFDTAGAQPLARCGYRDYSSVTELFELIRPSDGGAYTGVDK